MGQMPKSVVAAAQAADELHKQTYEVAPEEQPAEPVVPEEPKPAEPVQGELFADAATQPKPPKGEDTVEYWKQRFQTLKGKYDAELPRVVGQLRQAEHDNRQLLNELNRVSEQFQAAQSKGDRATKFNTDDDDPLVTEEEKSEYGADFTAFLERIAKQAASKVAKSQTPAPQAPVAAPQARPPVGPNVYQVLDQQVPRWREINKDPEFLGWLQHPDPLSGSTRHHMLASAFERSDATRVLAFFTSYLQSSGQPVRPADPQPAPAPKVSLEQLAGPRQTAPSGQSTTTPAKRVWTGKDIDAFYRKSIAGGFRGKEAEKARIEGEIATAIAEGRVQTGQ